MIAVQEPPKFVKVTRLIPVCCSKAMLLIGSGAGRKRYYRCSVCQCKKSGTTTKENLP